MGQLEKYGLYVLCLVIFLILGVAIWGGDPASLPQHGTNLATTDAGKGKDLPKEPAHEPVKDGAKDQLKTPPPEASKSQGEGLASLFSAHPRGGEKDTKNDKQDTSSDSTMRSPNDASAAKALAPNETKPAADQKPRLYVVKDHDSLSRIAEKELGSAARLHEIEALNPTVKGGRIRPGDQLKLPAVKAHEGKGATPALAKSDADEKAINKSKPAPGSSYKVRQGDTLTSISRAAYGSDKHVRAILAANSGKVASANSLKEHTILALPAKP